VTLDRQQSGDSVDRRGVSSVVGVSLIVAVTVILAAVIATFTIGFGDSVNDKAPVILFTCEDGDPVVSGGETGFEGTLYAENVTGPGAKADVISAGVTLSTGSKDIVWESPDGETTAIIFEGCE